MMGSPDLKSVEAARHELLARLEPVGMEERELLDCLNRVLAEDITSPHSLPPFDASSMDGYAVRAQDVAGASYDDPARLEVIGEAAAGHEAALNLKSGQAARITTGSVIPVGANAVVPVEWTGTFEPQAGEDVVRSIAVSKPAGPGAFIRPAGLDVEQGQLVLTEGTRIKVQDIALMAATGRDSAVVHRRPRVAVFSTGDELRDPGDELSPGAIYDANGPMIRAALIETGVEPVWLGIIRDTKTEVEKALNDAVQLGCDLVLSTAGVSMGSHDYVRLVLEEQGELEFWRVNIRPGKPLAFGSYQEIPFIGLPGNPVSSWLTFNVFVRPAVRALSGEPQRERLVVPSILEVEVDSDGRESYLRAVVTFNGDSFRIRPSGSQDSAVLSSLAAANALLIVPQGTERLDKGARVQAWLFGENGLPAHEPGRASE